MQDFNDLTEKTISSKEIYDGHVVHLYKDTVELPNGHTSIREVIRHVGAVAIVPITDDGQVVVERQFRYPFNQVYTEIPAGKLDSKTEDRLAAAKRELEEETGYLAEHVEWLITTRSMVAFSNEKVEIYVATGLVPTKQKLDQEESIVLETYTAEELKSMIFKGEIQDSKTVAALMAYFTKYDA